MHRIYNTTNEKFVSFSLLFNQFGIVWLIDKWSALISSRTPLYFSEGNHVKSSSPVGRKKYEFKKTEYNSSFKLNILLEIIQFSTKVKKKRSQGGQEIPQLDLARNLHTLFADWDKIKQPIYFLCMTKGSKRSRDQSCRSRVTPLCMNLVRRMLHQFFLLW